jgi:hypothetical protein
MPTRTKKVKLPETIAAKRKGRPENFSPCTVTQRSADDAMKQGFAMFNGGKHLCVDVPDDSFTVSCRTSEGRRITFAFLPYRKDGPPQAVDIQYHDSPVLIEHSDTVLPAQSFIGFGPNRGDVRYSRHATRPCTLLSVIMSDECPSVTEAKAEADLLQTVKDLLTQIGETCKARKFTDGPLCLAAEATRDVVRKVEGRAT